MFVIEKLDQLAEMRARLEDKQAALKARREMILTPEVQTALDLIQAQYDLEVEPLIGEMVELEAAIKTAVIEAGQTVKGSSLMAAYAKGRTTWDSKALEGYAAAHPEINPFRSTTAPSVSIRGIRA